MGFFNNLLRIIKGGTSDSVSMEISVNQKFGQLYTETYINYLAFYSNVNRIANAFCKCTFDTFIKSESVKKDEWYLWNVQPNKNQSAYEFKNQLITRLYENNEALIVEMPNGDLYVADNYVHDKYTLYEDVFRNVTVRKISMSKTYTQSEVLFFKLNDVNIKNLIDGMTTLTKKLMNVAIQSYAAAKGEKVILDIDDVARGDNQFKATFSKLLNEDFKNYFNSEKAVLPLFDGYTINGASTKPDHSATPKDIIDLINTAIETNAQALNVPVALAKGSVQDTTKIVDELLTFCVDPLVKMIEEEILRKRYGLNDISNGNYLKIDSKSIKHVDIFDVSTSIEKLISSACFTVNDIRRKLGLPEIDEDWANEFFMTKNFSTIEDLMNALKGGGTNE